MTCEFIDSFDQYGDDSSKMLDGPYAEAGSMHKTGDGFGVVARTGTHFLHGGNNQTIFRRALKNGNVRVAGLAVPCYPVSLGSRGNAILSFRDADNNVQISVQHDSTGALIIVQGADDGGTVIHTNASPDLTLNAWQHVEGRVDCDAVNGTVEVRVNGVTKVNLTGINTRPYTTATGGAGRIAQLAARSIGAGNGGFCVDDIIGWSVRGTMGETMIDFVGDKKVGTRLANGDQSTGDFAIVADQVARGVSPYGANGNAGGTLAAPSDAIPGELWIATVFSADNNAHAMSGDWTQIFQEDGPGSSSRLSVWWHRYNGTAPSMVVTKAAGNSIFGKVKAFKNLKYYGDPVDTVGAKTTGTDATAEVASITPSQAGCMILLACGANHQCDSTMPAGFTSGAHYADSFGGGNHGTVDLDYLLDQDGSATGALVHSYSGNTPSEWLSVAIAIAPGTDVPGYAAISEAAPDDDSTYLSGTAVGESDFTIAALPSDAGTVSVVQVYTRAKKSDAGTCNFQNALVANGVEGDGADNPLTTAYRWYDDVFPLNPDTGSPWEPSEVNDVILRLKRTA